MLSVSSLTSKIIWTTKFAAIDVDAMPIIQGDTAYINSGNFLVAVNAVTGRGRWQTDLGEPIAFGPAVGPNGVLVVTRDGKGLIYNLNGRRTLKDPVDVGSAPVTVPTAVGEMYLVPTANGAINLVEPKEGKVIWSFVIRPLVPPTGGNTKVIEAQVVDTRLLSVQAAGPAVVAGNTILVLAQDGSLLAFDPETGVDLTPPEAFMVWPMPGSQVSGQPPLELVFKVDDEATGVKIDTLKIDIDGNPVEFTVGRDLVAVVRFSHSGPNKPLMDGRKVINLSVEDWMGNVQKKSYSLSIDNMLPPLQRPGAAPAKPTQPSGGGRPGRRGGTGPGV
jgi:hypothetical protein